MRGFGNVCSPLLGAWFIVLSGGLLGCGGPLASDAVALEEPSPNDAEALASMGLDPKKVAKREAVEKGERRACTEVEVDNTGSFERTKEIKQLHYTFFMMLKPDFKEVKFNLLIDNLWNIAPTYDSYETISFDRKDLEAAADSDQWIEFRVEYFKHVVRNGRDKHGLRVTVGNTTREVISSRWWRTHSYEGSLISVRGPASLLFDCPPLDPISPIPAQLLNTPALLGGVLAVAFLLVAVPWACIMQRRRKNRISDEAPEVPPLPKSLLLEKEKVSKSPDHDNVYEEFDEDTMSRLRQKLSAEALGGEAESPYHHYEKLKPRPLQRKVSMEKQQAAPSENYYENTAPPSLREQKEKARMTQRQRSRSESHYVEMHGILSRRSFDFTK